MGVPAEENMKESRTNMYLQNKKALQNELFPTPITFWSILVFTKKSLQGLRRRRGQFRMTFVPCRYAPKRNN